MIGISRTVLTAAIIIAVVPVAAATKDLLVGSEQLSFGSLQVDLPPGWVVQYNDADSPSGVAYSFMAAGGKEFTLLVTAFPALAERSPEERCALARTFAEAGVQFFAETAEESEIPVHEEEGQGNCLYRISVTDKTVEKPTMEDFKYVTMGGMATGHLFASFTILHNVKDEPEIGVALKMLRTARHVDGPDDPSATAAAAIRLSYPGRHWSLVIDASGMQLDAPWTAQGGTSWSFGGNSEDQDLTMTLSFEPADLKDDPKVYRKRYRKNVFKAMAEKVPVKQEKIRETDKGAMALLWYTNVIEGVLRQPNVNAFLVRDAVWIDIHLSSTQDEERAHEMFNRFLDAARFEE
jgi:hypothetical protein